MCVLKSGYNPALKDVAPAEVPFGAWYRIVEGIVTRGARDADMPVGEWVLRALHGTPPEEE